MQGGMWLFSYLCRAKGNGNDKYEKDIVCMSREYLPESDGGVCDEGSGG